MRLRQEYHETEVSLDYKITCLKNNREERQGEETGEQRLGRENTTYMWLNTT